MKTLSLGLWVRALINVSLAPRNLSALLTLALAAVSLPVGVYAQNGVLATEMNTTNNELTVYYVPFSSPDFFEQSLYQPGFFEQNLYQQVYTSTGKAFGPPTQVTGIGGTPPVGSASPLGIAAYYDGVNEIYYLFTASPGVKHVEQIYTGGSGDLTQNAGAQPAAANSDLVGFADSCNKTDDLFYIGSDQHVHLLTRGLGAAGWTTEDLTSLTSTPNAIGGTLTGQVLSSYYRMSTEEVYYIDSNSHVHQLWSWSGSGPGVRSPGPCDTVFDGWHDTDLYETGGGGPNPAPGSSLVNFANYQSLTDKVTYVGTDHHVHQYASSFSNNASPWTNVDVTAAARAANVGAGNVLTAHVNTTIVGYSEEVFFVDGESNIEELWITPGASWVNNPSPYRGAPAVFAAGPLQTAIVTNVNSINGTDDFYYVGSDGNLYQVSWNESWSLSALATLVEPPYKNNN